ncbi:hypothetical protein E8E14_001539 [Neopestalotiopsis sp. 37M]|nr:hypothetical protein E8E14_001539 [Neopestalotiopsis sp. 37M]
MSPSAVVQCQEWQQQNNDSAGGRTATLCGLARYGNDARSHLEATKKLVMTRLDRLNLEQKALAGVGAGNLACWMILRPTRQLRSGGLLSILSARQSRPVANDSFQTTEHPFCSEGWTCTTARRAVGCSLAFW